MKVKFVLNKSQALALLEHVAKTYRVQLPPEWLSHAWQYPFPFCRIELGDVPDAVAQPETWRERFRSWARALGISSI